MNMQGRKRREKMFKMNILARPLHKARIHAGSDARNCTKFTHIVTQFVQSLILL